MPVKSAAVKTVDQVLDMDMSVDGIQTRPSRIRQWFTNNIIRRMFAYPIMWDGVHFKLQRASKDGVVLTAPVGGGLEPTLMRNGSVPDSWSEQYWGVTTADQIMISVWDKPVYLQTSKDDVSFAAIMELNADQIYILDIAVKRFKIKNKTAGQTARYELVGFFKI